jgi:hypothetical protein
MEGGLSDRALKVLRAVLHLDFSEMPDPAVVACRISLFELACERACGPATLAEIRNWLRSHGHELGAPSVDSRFAFGLYADVRVGQLATSHDVLKT